MIYRALLMAQSENIPKPLIHYDFSRYSNQEFTDNPDMLVKDLTGNGYDLRLYNFAFSGMSGFGGYNNDFSNRKRSLPNNSTEWDWGGVSSPFPVEVSPSKLHISWGQSNTDNLLTFYANSLKVIPAMRVKVTGMNPHIRLNYKYDDGSFKNLSFSQSSSNPTGGIQITKDGVYDLPATTIAQDSVDQGNGNNYNRGWGFVRNSAESYSNVIIEQLPIYPGGLVSDGVDDYGLCVKDFALPNDYTVCAIRKFLDSSVNGAFVSKDSVFEQSAFLFEYSNNRAISFGAQTLNLQFSDLFSYQTKTSYNGTYIASGNVSDSENNKLQILKNSLNAYYTKAVLYDLRIYDHSLTDEELQLVKDDMMRNYEKNAKPLEGITYVADWDAKGRSNDEEADVRNKWVDKATGKTIDLNNFAYAGMSGWNGYGTDFKSWTLDNTDGATTTATENTITIKNSIHPQNIRNNSTGAWKAILKVDKNCILYYIEQFKDGSPANIGAYTFKAGVWQEVSFEDKTDILNLRWTYFMGYSDNSLVITQAPYYPGALVGDGIDDYGVTQEAINEEVGTMLLHYRRLIEVPTKWGYYYDALNSTRIYAAYINTSPYFNTNMVEKYNDGNLLIGTTSQTVDAILHIMANCSAAERGQAAIFRLIIIKEQLDDAQVEFLRWKVEKEYRDWCKKNGYNYALNQLTE